jgi:hypothetical protein
MKLADYITANPGAKDEIASYASGELGMLSKSESESAIKTAVTKTVNADRVRMRNCLRCQG